MRQTTEYLNLDDVVPEKEVIIKLRGKDHKLEPISVEGFVANTQDIEAFAATEKPTTAQEIDMLIGMLLRSFPTMSKDMLMKLTVLQLNKLNDFTQAANGAKKVAEEAAAENPPTAGQ